MTEYDSYSILRRPSGDYYINLWDSDQFTLAKIGSFSSPAIAERRAQELGLCRVGGGKLPSGVVPNERAKRRFGYLTPVVKTFDEAWADGIRQFQK